MHHTLEVIRTGGRRTFPRFYVFQRAVFMLSVIPSVEPSVSSLKTMWAICRRAKSAKALVVVEHRVGAIFFHNAIPCPNTVFRLRLLKNIQTFCFICFFGAALKV